MVFICCRLWVCARSTWPEQALRANIHAQISLALNRVYTEWYANKGYPFTITNSTSYDQYYVHGRTVFEPMERITDDIFNTYLRKDGNVEPFYAEYCDGKQVTCKGMKQWGTVDLANQGKNALQILRYYYGNTLEIVRTNNIQAILESYPGTPLRKGDTGPNVATLQRQLTRIAKNYPLFGQPGTDGVYGDATEKSVKAFQKQFTLTVDGVVGRATWYKISGIYVAVKKLAELTSEGEKPSGSQDIITGTGYPGTPLRRGDRGKNVEEFQFWLEQLAEFDVNLQSVSVDGIFGANTEAAVKKFQTVNGLLSDGVVGKQTWNALYTQYQSLKSDIDQSANGYPGSPVRIGATGDSVRRIQFWLRIISTNFSSIPAPTVDGIFGAGTQTAVKAFQKEFGLTQDGIVGTDTWGMMYQIYADVANNLLPEDKRPGVYPGAPLRNGSTGNGVREAQYYLIILSAFYPSIPRITLDGEFGASTEAAVKAFQKLVGLTQDGIIGPATWQALFLQATKLRSTAIVLRAFDLPTWPGKTLQMGDSGAEVERLQYMLTYIAYFYELVQAPDAITEVFDDSTRISLESFQSVFNFPQTGTADETIWNALEDTVLSLSAGGSEESLDGADGTYPGYATMLNSASGGVLNLQKNLNTIARMYCTQNFVPETGIFDSETQARVYEHQANNSLLVTGTVEKQTWDSIVAAAGALPL